MEYGEALDIVSRLRTQHQAYEKIDEVLRKAHSAENHTKELEQHRDSLQRAIETEQAHLEDMAKRRNALAKEAEARLAQLKGAEDKARQARADAEAGLERSKQELHKTFITLNGQLQAEHNKKKAALQAEIDELEAQLEEHKKNISMMKELARAVI
jgi:chromosome segregation ATPase